MKHAIWLAVALAVITGLVVSFWPRKLEEAPDAVVAPLPPSGSALPGAAGSADVGGGEEEPVPAFLESAPPPAAADDGDAAGDADGDADEAPAKPAEAVPTRPALPPLDESDAEVSAALRRAAGSGFVERHLVDTGLVRRIVTTVDNAPRARVGLKVRAIRPLDGRFAVQGSDDQLYLDPANYIRYAPLAGIVTAMSPGALVDAYQQYYPLLQEAYAELGYPGRQFHSRVLEVIDHLLATPEVKGPIPLVRPHVMYQFADPSLESLSAGQKALIRMGPGNAAAVKAKLRAVRDVLEERAAQASSVVIPDTASAGTEER